VVIGSGAKVLGNIAIGNNCRVGAGSVVLRSVPENSTVVGVPAHIVLRNGRRVVITDPKEISDPFSDVIASLVGQLQDLRQEIRTLKPEASLMNSARSLHLCARQAQPLPDELDDASGANPTENPIDADSRLGGSSCQCADLHKETLAMVFPAINPFDNIEAAQEYLALLSESISENRKSIQEETMDVTSQSSQRGLEVLRLVFYNLDKLEKHLKVSRQTLSNLHKLRKLLLGDNITDVCVNVASCKDLTSGAALAGQGLVSSAFQSVASDRSEVNQLAG
jgi:hypothetical protein